MYKLEIRKSPDTIALDEEFESGCDDLISAIDQNLPEGSRCAAKTDVWWYHHVKGTLTCYPVIT